MKAKLSRWHYALNSNCNQTSVKYPSKSSATSPQPLNTHPKYRYSYMYIFYMYLFLLYWMRAELLVPTSHDEGGVANRYQPLLVSLTTTNPVVIDASQHHEFLPFAEAELRTLSCVVTQHPNGPEAENGHHVTSCWQNESPSSLLKVLILNSLRDLKWTPCNSLGLKEDKMCSQGWAMGCYPSYLSGAYCHRGSPLCGTPAYRTKDYFWRYTS